MTEYLLACAALVAALLAPLVEGRSAVSLLMRSLADFFQGFSALLALA